MSEVSIKIICDNCGYELQKSEKICPKCHSEQRGVFIQVCEKIHISGFQRLKGKNTQYPSDKKLRYDFMQGDVPSNITYNGRAKLKRIIDKDNDYYYEHVEDHKGKVIHHCEEPLSKHYNHGSAKKINDNSRKLD